MKKFILILACLFAIAFIAARVLVPDEPATEVIINAVSERIIGAKSEELPWPPIKSKTYPNLDLLSLSGKSYELEQLKGTPFIVIPIDMRSANSQVQVGAKTYGSLNNVSLSGAIVNSLESQIGKAFYQKIRIVHLILYNSGGEAPSTKDLRTWSSHFQLAGMRNHMVLGARDRHILWSKKKLTYGCQYVNNEFKLEVDATHGNYTYIKKKIKPRLGSAIQVQSDDQGSNMKVLRIK